MYSIIYLNMAKHDLTSIVSYIKYNLKNPSAANNMLNLIENEVKNLIIFPFANSVVYNSSDGFNYRVVRIKNYLVFYKINNQSIVIIRIMYYRRNWKNILD